MAGLPRCGRGLFCSFLDFHPVCPHGVKKISKNLKKGAHSGFLGGPQRFDEGVARISRANRTPFFSLPPLPRSFYFLTRSHLSVTSVVWKCFTGNRPATPKPSPASKTKSSMVVVLKAALFWRTLCPGDLSWLIILLLLWRVVWRARRAGSELPFL